MLSTFLLILLILLLVGAVPAWPYSANWGFSPMGIIVVLLILYFVLGRGYLG